MTDASPSRQPAPEVGTAAPDPAAAPTFRTAPARFRAFLLTCEIAALVLPFLLGDLGPDETAHPIWLTIAALVGVSVLNVEISRALAGGLEWTHQPHKALSAWAFASALLLPVTLLLVVVPLTYAHARWRGLRLPLWKWVGSAAYLVLAGLAAALVREVVFGDRVNWMDGNGGRGLLALLASALVFLAVESALFAGSALLNVPEDEVWLRETLTTASFYSTEMAVLLIGGLLAAVWTGGPWFVLFFVPIYVLAQRAALHEPLRARADAAAALAAKNDELESAGQFKVDLLGMVGHEIGNPLTSILGYSQLGTEALDEGDTRTAQAAMVVVERNAAQIRSVLHEILGFVRSDRNALTALPEMCELAPRLRAAADTQPPGRQPEIRCPAGLAALIQPGHLDQVLANLLSNAEKYAGGATHLTAARVDPDRVEITVRDAGPGVPVGFRSELFRRFSRDGTTARQVSGTGLGLFISQELVRANGGEISYRDGVPCGAVFAVTLPG